MMMNRTRDVETRSYFIWEREGRPQGRDWEHWFQAESEISAEAAVSRRQLPAVAPSKRKIAAEMKRKAPSSGKTSKRKS